jgi:hypothetical protein
MRLGQPLLHWKPIAHPKVKDNGVEWNTGRYSLAIFGAKLNYQIPIRIFTIKGVPKDVE